VAGQRTDGAGVGPRSRVPRVSAFYGIVIYIYAGDHPPPHFHAAYAEYEVKMAIRTLTVVAGWLPPRKLKLVREWAFAHRHELLVNWDRAGARQPLNKIDPLP